MSLLPQYFYAPDKFFHVLKCSFHILERFFHIYSDAKGTKQLPCGTAGWPSWPACWSTWRNLLKRNGISPGFSYLRSYLSIEKSFLVIETRYIGKFLRCRSNERLMLWDGPTNQQIAVEIPTRSHETSHEQLSEWTWIDEPMNQWVNASQRINESMDQWHWMNNEPRMQRISESRSHRNNEPTNQLMNIESNTESMIQGISESMNQSLNQWIANQWANESVNQWFNKTNKINEPMIQRTNESNYATWIHESMSQWINEGMCRWISEAWNERTNMNGWMDDDWVRYYLLAASSLSDPSLRHLFSQLLLLWAASSLDYFCSELPPSDLFCSFCNPILVFAQPILCV